VFSALCLPLAASAQWSGGLRFREGSTALPKRPFARCGDGISCVDQGGSAQTLISSEGVELDSAGTPQGTLLGLDFGADFSLSKAPACVGGSEPGSSCAADSDCAGGGICTADSQHTIALSSNVYKEGDTIQPSDLPSVVLRTDADRSVASGTDITFLSGSSVMFNLGAPLTIASTLYANGALVIPAGTASAPTGSRYLYFDTDANAVGRFTIGDGTYAAPIGACAPVAVSYSNPGTSYCADSYCSSLPSQALATPTRSIEISGLKCYGVVEVAAGAEYVWDFERADLSSCTASADGGSLTCTWSKPADSPTCDTGVGTSATNEMPTCTPDANKMTVTSSQAYHLRAVRTGTWSTGIFACTWNVCILN